jgi:TonB family protein
MSINLIWANLVAYSLQIGLLVGLAAFVPAALRLRPPGARLVYWHVLLAACLLLPLVRPWKREAAGTVRVSTSVVVVVPAQPAPRRSLPPASEIALLLLAAGALARLTWLAAGFWKLRQYRRHSHPLEPASSWSVEADLRISGDLASPVTFGVRRPVVLLPAQFPELEAHMREAILCHEILHVRRRDWLFTVVEELVRALFWFHPAIWWLLGEIGLSREQAVDSQVVEMTKSREGYVDALLAIAGVRPRLDLAPAPLFLRKRHLKQRVISVLEEVRMSKTRLISALAAGLAILVAACWFVTGAFPLAAAPEVVNDSPGVTVDLGGAGVMHRTGVSYPEAALKQGVQGTVVVEVKLDSNGNVGDAHVVSGPDELRNAALKSVLQWHLMKNLAGSTRQVSISFVLPAAGSQSAVAAGAAGGVGGGVYRVGGGVSAPVLLYRKEPEYTEEARRARYSGTVQLYVEIDPSGTPTNIRVLQGPGLGLDERAIEAVRTWKFKPGYKDGNPVTVGANISVSFRLLDNPVSPGVAAGVAEGSPTGVLGGIIGSVPTSITLSRPTSQSAWVGRTLKAINVSGLSDQARADLLAQMPVHEGDTVSLDTLVDVTRVARAFDEHLVVIPMPSGSNEATLGIMLAGATAAGTMTAPLPPPLPPPPAGADATSPARVRVGANVQQTMLISQPHPVYPPEAKQARIQGVVKLSATIAKDGTVQNLEVLSGHPLLIPAALEAVKQWVYKPTLLNGQPVEVVTQIDVTFTLAP